MVLKKLIKRVLILSIFISPFFIQAAERKNSFIVQRSDGIVAVYCGKRATKKERRILCCCLIEEKL